jgi:integrase/recombinase XerD
MSLMNSVRQGIHEYLSMRRSLGFKLKYAGSALLSFANYLERHHAPYITIALALDWAKGASGEQPTTMPSQRLSVVRCFARYRIATDPRTQIPDTSLLPFRRKRAVPYLYSDSDIERLLGATLNMPLSPARRRLYPMLPWVYYCLFGLLAVSGLRLSEARNLELGDVDLAADVLTIRSAKHGRDRLVPLHPSTSKMLSQYLEKRNHHWSGKQISNYFFVSGWGNRLSTGRIHETFYAISRRIGLRLASSGHGPRLHDFRHSFATRTLTGWYRKHQEPERLLPLLSTFLGHVRESDTQWYLSGSPELMREAMTRLEHHWENRP